MDNPKPGVTPPEGRNERAKCDAEVVALTAGTARIGTRFFVYITGFPAATKSLDEQYARGELPRVNVDCRDVCG